MAQLEVERSEKARKVRKERSEQELLESEEQRRQHDEQMRQHNVEMQRLAACTATWHARKRSRVRARDSPAVPARNHFGLLY